MGKHVLNQARISLQAINIYIYVYINSKRKCVYLSLYIFVYILNLTNKEKGTAY